MEHWTSGYVADVDYTYGYYPELNPLRAKLAFLTQGIVFPEVATACELGFGQGLSTNIHAASSLTKWFGTDFNPSQAAYAQSLADISGSEAKLFDEAFLEFAHRTDLPDFDYIGLHGIWSWISNQNRQVIVDFLRTKLKPGGILYISYNTLPGWSSFAPIRHLMTEHAEVLGSQGHGILNRIDGAIEFAEKLIETKPKFGQGNPLIGQRLDHLKQQNRHYLAHEYFNRDWHPMHFSTMADWLGPAKVQYACSAHYLDHVEDIHLTPDQKTFLNEIPDPMFRETTRDFIVNQQFRRDYWVRGLRKLNRLEQTEALRSIKIMLITPKDDVSLTVTGARGEAQMNAPVYASILEALADYQPKSIGQIEEVVKGLGITLSQIIEATMVLTGTKNFALIQNEDTINQAKAKTDRLNAQLRHNARGSQEVKYLASPVTGSGVIVSRFEQLFLESIEQGNREPQNWAQSAWQIISTQGQMLMRDGKTLETPEENLAELTEKARTFAEKKLPILQALKIV